MTLRRPPTSQLAAAPAAADALESLVTEATARADLTGLEKRGLLARFEVGRRHAWRPADGLEGLL